MELSELECLKSLEDLKIHKVKGKRFPSMLNIEGEIEWELSRSKPKEKYQPLDWCLIVGCGEHNTAWSN